MSSPTELNLIQVKGLCKYLMGTKDYHLRIPMTGHYDVLWAYSDSDHAGGNLARRTTSCGVFEHGGAAISNFNRTQTWLHFGWL